MLIKVEKNENLMRDSRTKAILNINTKERDEFLKKRKMEEEHNNLVQQMSTVTQDLEEIKNMLRAVLLEKVKT